MVSKNQIKLITSLQQKKFRLANGLFLAEGAKVIGELLHSEFDLEHLYETGENFNQVMPEKRSRISEDELKKLSALAAYNNWFVLGA